MPTRQASSASDDDQEQSQNSVLSTGNIANGAKVKAEKVKKEKAAHDRRKVVEEVEDEDGARSQPSDDEDGEDDDEDVDEDEEEGENGEGSSRARKRARVSEDGEARPVKTDPHARIRVQTLPRDTDGWVPGSIMRIQLRNFVTYDYTEFRCGPALNMILGPNGTGKSSIACAICLGLNWPPSVLGRATELPSFVKLGQSDGHIEIELKGLPGKQNLVIKRTLNAKSKQSNFTLNGKSATGNEIKKQMAKLNVQVGNLCSFLPQDKVSEFAQMSSVQLLKETQRAAGDERLTEWHATLIDSGKQFRNLQELIDGEKSQLKVMVDRNTEQEGQVERFLTRQKIEKKIEELELAVNNQVYLELKARYYTAKNTQRAAHERAKELSAKNEPATNLLKEYEANHLKLNKKREQAKKRCTSTFQSMRSKHVENERLDTEVEKLQGDIEQAKKTDKQRKDKIKACEKEIARMEAELANPPETEDVNIINEEMKSLTAGRGEQNLAYEDLKDRARQIGQSSQRENENIEQCTRDLKRLDDKGQRKLEDLRRWNIHTYDAVVWLRQNQDQFREPILEPPFLSMTVPNKQFAASVEACINPNQMQMFVAQNQEDLNKLNHILNDSGQVLKNGGRVNTWFRASSVPLLPQPMSPEEMSRLGFQGYAIDFVDCPEALKSFLQRDVQLHRTAIGLQRVNIDEATALISSRGGASFIAGAVMNKVTRSRYGRRAAQNSTQDVRPAKNFVDSAVDPTEKRRIDDKIKEARNQLSVIEEEMTQVTKGLAAHKKEEEDYNRAMGALNARRNAVMKAKSYLQKLSHKIVAEQDKLRAMRSEPSAEAKAAKSKQDIIKLTKARLKMAKGYAELIRGLIHDHAEMTRVVLEHAQVGANKTALEAIVEQRDAKAQAAKDAFVAAHEVFEQAKIATRDALEVSKAAIANASEELQDRYKAHDEAGMYANKSAADLQEDLETERNNLEMNSGANPGVVEQYERRKREIETLTSTIAGRERNAEKIERAIKNARDNWEPALEALIASIGKKFSAAFDRIGCAGEIRISKHEDFDKWAIDILVKFRDKEKLQLLTGQRQSGGERSLTTILYLMSLTEEARSPFSLVDEINQGMDMRAERAVHNSMVEVTCKPDSGQYFLITPKLLPDLNYHERMKVLCVNNGEWLPDERHIGNMMGMVEACAQRRNRGANAP